MSGQKSLWRPIAWYTVLADLTASHAMQIAYHSHFDVGRKNKSLFLAHPSLHARYTMRMTLHTVNTDGNDGMTKARPYIKCDYQQNDYGIHV